MLTPLSPHNSSHPSVRKSPCHQKESARLQRVRISVLTILLLVGTSVCAFGAYPEPDDLFVNDYASVLTNEDSRNIRSLFTTLQKDTGIEAVVVTINSITDYGTGDSTIESFATNLFNAWRIGDSEKNNGVLLLVALKDRKMRIELGSAYGHRRDAAMKVVIEEYMVPSFQRGNHSRGIYKGVRAMIEKLTGTVPKDPTSLTTRLKDWLSMSWFILRTLPPAIWAVVATIGVLIFKGCYWIYQQDRKSRCPTCRRRMVRLDETADDAHLDKGQQLEEKLQAVNYDVWYCAHCEADHIRPHKQKTFYSRCSECGYRTLEGKGSVIQEATKYTTGKRKVIYTCRHCGYTEERVHTIPKIQEPQDSDSDSSFGSHSFSNHSFSSHSSSSRSSTRKSSSGGFGGGRSSGGGASGSW